MHSQKNLMSVRLVIFSIVITCLAVSPSRAINHRLRTTYFKYDNKMNMTKTYIKPTVMPIGYIGYQHTVLDYDELGRQTHVRRYTDPYGTTSADDEISLYVYDVASNLSKIVQKAPGNSAKSIETGDAVTVYTYDAIDRQEKVTDPVGGETIYEFDDGGNVTKQKVLVSGTTYLTTTTDYDALNRATKVTDASSHYRETDFNSRSMQYKIVAKSSGGTALTQQRFYYDNLGRMLTSVSFLDAGDTGSIDETSDRVTHYVYDSGSRVVTQKVYNNGSSTALLTTKEYDGYGRLLKTTGPDGDYTSQSYHNTTGLVTERKIYDSIDVRTFKQLYSKWNRLTENIALAQNSANNLTTEYTYGTVSDDIGSIIEPGGQKIQFSIDNLGRRIAKTEDYNGIARVTAFIYDRLGRMVTQKAFDESTEQVSAYTYDLAGRRTEIKYPDSSTMSYEFDLAGRMTKRTDPKSTVVDYFYEDRGLLTKKDAGTIEEVITYDGLGRITDIRKGISSDDDSVSKTTYAYDDLSRVTQETQEILGEGTSNKHTLDYDYDQAANRLTMKYEQANASSLLLAYAYNNDSINTSVKGMFRNSANNMTQYTNMLEYDYTGRNLSRRRIQTLYSLDTPGSMPEVYLDYLPSYDEHRRITQINNKTFYDGSDLDELAKYDYTYDKAGNRLSNVGNRGTGINAEGFSKIQNIPIYNYDGLYRVTAAQYDLGGGTTKNEDFEYDDLGNRITYYDHRNSITTAYADNVVNEYTTVGGTNVYYDAAGNLSRDENDYEYLYDYENRLTSVTYVGSGSTQVAYFDYDALGRLITSHLRYDASANAETQGLKYYYDGSNVIAEYDSSDNLSRRYIHGTAHVDERAILLEGEGDSLDTYSYLLQELDTVTGLISKNGTLTDMYTYDAYGNASLWGYRKCDMDRDGDMDMDDINEVLTHIDETPPTDPMADSDMSGFVDFADISACLPLTDPDEPPVTLFTSAVGNPYFFTGRRLHFMEDDLTGGSPAANKQVQYNRARHYCPVHGRWLQRDPSMYTDGMNLYEYVSSRPLIFTDSAGRKKCGRWIAAASPTVIPSDKPFILTRQSINLPTAGWLGVFLGIMDAAGQLNVTNTLPLDKIGASTDRWAWEFLGKRCWCPWKLEQYCKRCCKSEDSARWEKGWKFGPFAMTRGKIIHRPGEPNTSYNFKCNCSRPQVPPPSKWKCPKVNNAKCCKGKSS